MVIIFPDGDNIMVTCAGLSVYVHGWDTNIMNVKITDRSNKKSRLSRQNYLLLCFAHQCFVQCLLWWFGFNDVFHYACAAALFGGRGTDTSRWNKHLAAPHVRTHGHQSTTQHSLIYAYTNLLFTH